MSSNRPQILADPATTKQLVEATQGPHFLTTLSGCRMARWILPIAGERPEKRDCYHETQIASSFQSPRLLTNSTIFHLQSNDTMYVTFSQVPDFVRETLPLIPPSKELVLLLGEREYVAPPPEECWTALLEHSSILKIFCQNLPHYGSRKQVYHPKLTSFPYGIKQRVRDTEGPTNGNAYQQVFMESLQTPGERSDAIFVGYITKTSNLNDRSGVPTSDEYLPPLQFYQTISRHRYMFSPNGDRPECYRHYEALGLGTRPITQLSRSSLLFSHFEGTGLLFKEDTHNAWIDVNGLQDELKELRTSFPDVNQNAVLEEYWMDYVDSVVGLDLTWWDRYRSQGPTRVRDLLKRFLEND